MDGNEDVGEDGTFSHCGESVGSPPVVPVPGRRAGALQLADRGWSCWEKGKKREKSEDGFFIG